MRIYLIGFMGCGKTSTGKRLAAKLNYNFIDMDDMLEKEYHISISDLFSKYDEEAFRMIEQKVLQKTFSFHNTVISTGGGTPCYSNNMNAINDNGTSIYLRMSPKMIHSRLEDSKKPRPLIQNVPIKERLIYIEELLAKREEFYLQANHIIEAKEIDMMELFKLSQKE